VAAILDMNTSELDRGECRAAEALGLFEQLGDAAGMASALDAQALAALFRGRIPEAAEMYGRVFRLYRDAGKLLAAGTPRALRAWALHLMGSAGEALSEVEEALALEQMLGQIEGEAMCLWVRAEVLAVLSRVDESVDSATRALDITTRLGHREWTTFGLLALAMAHEASGVLDKAEAALREALSAAEGSPFSFSVVAGHLASLYAARGEFPSADLYVDHAMAHGTALSHYEPRLVQAEIAIARGEPGAMRLAAEALAAAESGGYRASASRARLERLLPGADKVPGAPVGDAR
jgi:tetratricopeptide (TPR) repeat protein